MNIFEACQKASSEGALRIREQKDNASQVDCVELFPAKRGYTILDAFSANIVVQVFNALNDANKQKFLGISAIKAVKIALSLANKGN